MGDSWETHRSTPNPQFRTNMLSIFGCAKRPLFPAESGNKLISDRGSEVSLFSLRVNKWGSWRRAAPSKPKTKTRNNDNMLVVVWGLGILRRDSGVYPASLP